MLSFVESHAVALYDTSLDSINEHARVVSQSMSKHARMLSESNSEVEEDYELVKKHAKEGCEAGQGFYIACYGGFFFGLVSLIFSSINVCNCCKDCCGGYQGQFKCFGIYGIISAVWQLICMILLLVLLMSVSGLNNIWLKYCKDSGTDCESDPSYQLIKGIETSLIVTFVISLFVFIGRVLTGVFSIIASNEPHSAQKAAQVGVIQVPMQTGVIQNAQPVVVKTA